MLDPVVAYDRLAPHYSQFSNRRAAYLRSVEAHIQSRIPAGAASLLDIGAGDGSRTLRIAAAANLFRVVLLEPSSGMRSALPECAELWPVRCEAVQVSNISQRFDVITCLWNVLGHVQGAPTRARALGVAAELLSPGGLLFVDVIHRYNLPSYGLVMTAARWLRDQLAPSDTSGDVVDKWQTAAGEIKAYGHVFADREVRKLAESAGLECLERIVIDYETGATRRVGCLGNLLYVFRRSS